MSSAASKLSTAADIASSDTQSLISDMRKALACMRSLAVDYERDGNHNKVEQLEEEVKLLLDSYEDCASLAVAIKKVPRIYQPTDQRTDFKRLIEEEAKKVKESSEVSGQCHQLFRQFQEAVWNVHHAGQPLPGDEQEDIIMTSTQINILNLQCPMTGKPIIELSDPVRCQDCRHIYDKDAIMRHIRQLRAPQCPVAGCPKVLQADSVVCDSLLRIEIEELRASGPAAVNATDIEDIEDVDEDENEDEEEDKEDDNQ